MDETNTPRPGEAADGPQAWTQPLYVGGPQAGDAGRSRPPGRWRRLGRGTRWTLAVAAAIALASASLLGVSLASGSAPSAGSSQAATAALTANAALQIAGASSGGAGNPASFRVAGPAGRRAAGARACVQAARRRRAAGLLGAARARFLACLRRYPRLRFLLRLRAIVRHAEHGQVTFDTKKGPRTLVFERGTIQSGSSGSVVVKAADGTIWTWDLTTSTVLTSGGHRVPASALEPGGTAVLVGLASGGANDARRIFVLN